MMETILLFDTFYKFILCPLRSFISKLRNMFRLLITDYFLDSLPISFVFYRSNSIQYREYGIWTLLLWNSGWLDIGSSLEIQNTDLSSKLRLNLSRSTVLNELKTTANRLTIKIQLKWVYVTDWTLNTRISLACLCNTQQTSSIRSRQSHFAIFFTLLYGIHSVWGTRERVNNNELSTLL